MIQSLTKKPHRTTRLTLRSCYQQQQVKTMVFFFIRPEKYISLKMEALHTAARTIFQK